MRKIPEVVNSISCRESSFLNIDPVTLKKIKHVCYTLNQFEDDETDIYTLAFEGEKTPKSNKIMEESGLFVNGYQVVKTANGEYAYVREKDHLLLPYRYDIAFNFNEYGLAMVGREGSVSWINKNFQYLNAKGEMVEDSCDNTYQKFDGWQGINDFNRGENPLSRVYNGRDQYGSVVYFAPNGQLKKFYRYDGNLDDTFGQSFFRRGTLFDKNGYAKADDCFLFAKGYLISYHDLFKICQENGYMDEICADATMKLQEEKKKVLKKK